MNTNHALQKNLKIAIIGAGAAGIFCAIRCAEVNPNAEVIVLEKGPQLLSKVKISGGGRCNVTHACFDPRQLIQNYPRGSRELLGPFNRYQPKDTIAWFKARGIELKVEADGRMFPITNSSQTIIDCLLEECNKRKVQIFLKRGVERLEYKKNFTLHLTDDTTLEVDKILIATGGNAASRGFSIAQALGHTVEPIVPSLFTFNCTDPRIEGLSGISVSDAFVTLPALKLKQRGPVLITHWGFSGPGILKLSAWAARALHACDYNFSIHINWAGTTAPEELLEKLQAVKQTDAKKVIININPFSSIIPNRLWERLVSHAVPEAHTLRWADISKAGLNTIVQELSFGKFQITGKSLHKDEFVSCGGVRLSEIDFKTMESKICPGVYFAGEALDIDAITGGFNFQAAWTTGWVAGSAMGEIAETFL